MQNKAVAAGTAGQSLSSTKLEVMEYIANKFKETSASDIAKISHLESAWKENIEGKRISYHLLMPLTWKLCKAFHVH